MSTRSGPLIGPLIRPRPPTLLFTTRGHNESRTPIVSSPDYHETGDETKNTRLPFAVRRGSLGTRLGATGERDSVGYIQDPPSCSIPST